MKHLSGCFLWSFLSLTCPFCLSFLKKKHPFFFFKEEWLSSARKLELFASRSNPVATPCHAAQQKHSLSIQPERDGELDGGRERWGERERERDLAGDVKQYGSFSLASFLLFFFSSQLIYDSENLRSPSSLLGSSAASLFFFFSLSPPDMWWKPCPAPIQPPSTPLLPLLLSSSPPLSSSPLLSWHRQTARLGRDNRHYRASLVRGGRRRSCFVVMERGSSGMRRLFFFPASPPLVFRPRSSSPHL